MVGSRHRVAGAPVVPGSTAHSPPMPFPRPLPSPPRLVMKSRSTVGAPEGHAGGIGHGQAHHRVESPVGSEAVDGTATVEGHPQAPVVVDAHPVGDPVGGVDGHHRTLGPQGALGGE